MGYFVDPEEALKKVKKTQKGQKWRFNVNEENGQRDDNMKKEQSCGINCDCGDFSNSKVDETKKAENTTEKNTKASDQETDEEIEEDDVAENTEESKQIVYENSSKIVNSS